MMNINKKTAIILLLVISTILTSTTVYARWHFKGGTVHDVINEVQEKILTAKEKYITNQVERIEELKRIANTKLSDITTPIQNITKELSVFKKETDSLLSYEPNRAKEELKNLYKININGSYADKLENVRDLQQLEIDTTLTKANAVQSDIQELQKEVDRINADYSAGIISEKQKIALLRAINAQMVNAKSLVESQRDMNEMSDDATRYNEQRIANSVISDQNLSLPGRNMDEMNKEAEKYRIKSLPR